MHRSNIVGEQMVWPKYVFKQVHKHLKVRNVILLFDDIIEKFLSEFEDVLHVSTLENL
jgi:hypothetical protein